MTPQALPGPLDLDRPASPGVVASRTVVRHRSGRSVAAVTLAADGGPPRRAFEKRYPSLAQGRRAHRAWRALEGVDFGPAAGVPALAGWDPARRALRSWAAEGAPLDALPQPRLTAGAAAAGAWLARLHAAPVRLERVFDLAHELRNAGLWAAQVGAVCFAQDEPARDLHARLCRAAGALPPAAEVPIHKDFHPGHVLVGDARLVVLDFDEMRMGDPAFDVAHFGVYLRLAALRRRGALDAFEPAERAFVGRYRRDSGRSLGAAVAVFTAYTCLKVAKQLALETGVPPRPRGAARDRELAQVLAHGRASLGPLEGGKR